MKSVLSLILRAGLLVLLFNLSGCAVNVTHKFNLTGADVLPRDAAIEYVNVHFDANNQGIILGWGAAERHPFEDTVVRVETDPGRDECYCVIVESIDYRQNYKRNVAFICNGDVEAVTRKLLTALVSLGVTPQ